MSSPYLAQLPALRRNVRRVYRRRTAVDITLGASWYGRANATVRHWAHVYDLPIACVANIVAAVSPQCDWRRNLLVAHDVLRGYPATAVHYGALPSNVRKAVSIRADRFSGSLFERMPHGFKVAAFARNLSGDYSAVTVDTHGIQAAHDNVLVTMTLKRARYDLFARAYADVAYSLQLEPAILQSIVWHVWKWENPRGYKLQERRQWHTVGMEDE